MSNKELLEHNREAWNILVKAANRWTIAEGHDEILAARNGKLDLYLTPTKFVPQEWLGDVKGKKVLCLASGGGQQGPLLAAAGADVTAFDLSDLQLAQDRLVAEREGLNIRTVQGNMQDLSVFENESFDLVFNPASVVFIDNVLPVWKECFRVLKKGGKLLTGFTNPLYYLFDSTDPDKTVKLEVVNKIPYSDIDTLSKEDIERFKPIGYPLEHSHTLDDLIGGQIAAGFLIAGFFEDNWTESGHPLEEYIKCFIATMAVKSS